MSNPMMRWRSRGGSTGGYSESMDGSMLNASALLRMVEKLGSTRSNSACDRVFWVMPASEAGAPGSRTS